MAAVLSLTQAYGADGQRLPVPGTVDGCALPSYGFTNRGCNCTSPCKVRPELSDLGRSACDVDALCPASFSSSLALSGWWDFCDVPSTLRTAPLPYCALRFFEPACQAANSTAPDDLKTLGRYLSIPGSNYTFSFLDAAFTKTVLGGGAGATSTGRSAGLGSASSASMAAVDVARAVLASTIPITSALGLTVSVLLLATAGLLLKGVARCAAKLCAKKKLVSLEAAVRSATPAQKEGKKKKMRKAKGGEGAEGEGEERATYAVPLGLALAGVPARSNGAELHLVGHSFSIRAQAHVYEELNMLATLGSAHVELKPEHLALAEADGVFECVRGGPPPPPSAPARPYISHTRIHTHAHHRFAQGRRARPPVHHAPAVGNGGAAQGGRGAAEERGRREAAEAHVRGGLQGAPPPVGGAAAGRRGQAGQADAQLEGVRAGAGGLGVQQGVGGGRGGRGEGRR